MKQILSIIFLFSLAFQTFSSEYHVTTNGTAGGTGTSTSPWDLQTSFNKTTTIKGGDTLWVHGGTYYVGSTAFTCNLVGQSENPIVVRNYKNERAIIDTAFVTSRPEALTAKSTNVWYWGLEIRNSNPTFWNGGGGLSVPYVSPHLYPSNRFINMTLWDNGNTNNHEVISCFNGNAQFYGNIVMNTRDGYGIYTHNRNTEYPVRLKVLDDNIWFNNVGSGGGRGAALHVYSGGGMKLDNVYIRGNIIFQNALNYCKVVTYTDGSIGNYFQGTVQDNYTYDTYNWMFNYALQNTIFERNVLVKHVGSPVAIYNCGQGGLTINNIFRNNLYDGNPTFIDPNSCSGVSSVGNMKVYNNVYVFVRTNQYYNGSHVPVAHRKLDTKLAHIAIYNYGQVATTATVDLTGILNVGDSYEIRDIQHYFYEMDSTPANRVPVKNGTYNGGSIMVNLMGDTSPVIKPVWDATYNTINWPWACSHTTSDFNAYVLIKTSSEPPGPTKPEAPTDLQIYSVKPYYK